MKKTILALFLLLFILIVTCAYEKSHTIYAKTEKEHTAPVHNTETVSIAVVEKPVTPPVKEKIIAAKTLMKKNEVKMVVPSEQSASAEAEKNTPKSVPAQNAEKEEVVEEQTLLSKLKVAVMKRLSTGDQVAEEKFLEESKSLTQKNTPAQENTPTVVEDISLTVTYNTSEEEIVDHLVEALRNQELAFKNRDKFMLEIEALIKRALDDRCAEISHRKKEELALKKTQKIILEERDLNTKKIPESYTINPGE